MLLAAAARIISTYVENTIWKLQESLQCKDHLHIRGEYVPKSWSKKRKAGSSPHTWRILNTELGAIVPDGIISTYVENTTNDDVCSFNDEDHLHIRGEYSKFLRATVTALGSSPHTWRILPLKALQKLLVKDHLHIRGEYVKQKERLGLSIGSSPHTWRIRQ